MGKKAGTGPARFALRLPRSLYQAAVEEAAREGISLNTYIISAVSNHIGLTQGRREGIPWPW